MSLFIGEVACSKYITEFIAKKTSTLVQSTLDIKLKGLVSSLVFIFHSYNELQCD